MTILKAKSGRKPKNGIRSGVHLDPEVYNTLKFRGELSTEIERAVRATMKMGGTELSETFRAQWEIAARLQSADLDDLEIAIYARRLELMAAELRNAGFTCRTGAHDVAFRYVLVYPPDGDHEAQWATLAECRRLLDTARNLAIQEAFDRWIAKVEPLAHETYTRAQAESDVREERAEAKQQYENGEIGAEDYRLRHTAARDYLDLAE